MFKLFKKKKTVKVNLFGDEIELNVDKLEKWNKELETTKLDKLVDGELPFGWYAQNCAFLDDFKQKESRLIEYAIASRNTNGQEKINILKELIEYYNQLKKETYAMGECYQKHFDDNFLHCHNSRCNDFEYIQPYIDELEKLTK